MDLSKLDRNQRRGVLHLQSQDRVTSEYLNATDVQVRAQRGRVEVFIEGARILLVTTDDKQALKIDLGYQPTALSTGCRPAQSIAEPKE